MKQSDRYMAELAVKTLIPFILCRQLQVVMAVIHIIGNQKSYLYQYTVHILTVHAMIGSAKSVSFPENMLLN